MTRLHLAPFIVFSAIWLAQVAMPGPNFVRVSQAALSVSRRAAMTTALGTATGNSLWCAAALAGAAALAQDPMLGLLLRVFGAVYLAGYGVNLLVRAIRPRAAIAVDALSPAGGWRAFFGGVATALSNPQTVVFFATSLLTLFPGFGLATVLAILAVVFAINIGWYAIVTSLLTSPLSRAAYLRMRPWIEGAFALLLLAAAWRILAAIGPLVATPR